MGTPSADMVFHGKSLTSDELLLEDLAWLGRLARRLVGDPAAAEDVVQETWLAVLRRPREAGPPERPWLARVARNLAAKTHRGSANRRAREEASAKEEALPSPDELILRLERQRLLSDAVVRLREPYRSTLILRYAEGLEPAEIARRQQVPGGTVRRRIHQGLAELREDLDRRFGGERNAWHQALAPLVATGLPITKAAVSQAVLFGGVIAMKKLVLAFLVLAIAAGSFGFWRWNRPTSGYASADVSVESAPLDQADTAQAPADSSKLAGIDRQPERAEVLRTEADDTQGTDGIPISGRVLRPMRCGDDSNIEVLALDSPASYLEFVYGRSAEIYGTIPTVLDRQAVQPDGTFTLSFPTDLKTGYILVRGSHLFSERSTTVSLENPPGNLEIATRAGGTVRGRLVERGTRAPLADTEVRLSSRSKDISPATSLGAIMVFSDGAQSAADGSFVFLGVPELGEYEVSAYPDQHAAHLQVLDGISVCAETEIELLLSSGGEVRGHVLDKEGAPIHGAQVEAFRAGQWLGFDDDRIRGAETEKDGSFVLDALPNDEIYVRASKTGFLPSTKEEIHPIDGGSTDGLRLMLSSGLEIQGTLVDTGGEPVANVEVRAEFDRAFRSGDSLLNALRGDRSKAITDSKGVFRLKGLGDGPFSLSAMREEAGETNTHHAQLDGIRPGKDAVRMILVPLRTLSGTALSGELPVTAFSIHASRVLEGPEGEMSFDRLTQDFEDPAGRFAMEGLLPGTWEVWATAEGMISAVPVRVHLSGDSQADIILELTVSAALAGRVLTEDGKPVGGARVCVDLPGPSWLQPYTPSQPTTETLTTADGSFYLEGLAPEPISVFATAPTFANSRLLAVDPLPGQTIDSLELVLLEGGAIEGSFYGKDGHPLPGRMVEIQHSVLDTTFISSTNQNGRFRFEELDEGLWAVTGLGVTEIETEEGLDLGRILEGLKTALVAVRPGELTYVELGSMPEEPIELFGEVRAGNEPYANAWLVLIPSTGDTSQMRITTTDSEGRYSVELDAPGDYSLSLQQYRKDVGNEATIDFTIEVPVTDRHRHDVQVPLGEISGRVVGPGGEALAGARVTVIGQGRPEDEVYYGGHMDELLTDEEGRYLSSNLMPGKYYVLAGGAKHARIGHEALELTADESLNGIDFQLPEPGSIEVVAFDGYGHPVSGVTIFARGAEDAGAIDPISSVVTDDGGSTIYTGLAPGDYTLYGRSRETACLDGQRVSVVSGKTATTELHMQPGTRLWVELTKGGKFPIKGWVEVFDENDREVAGAYAASMLEEIFVMGGFAPTRQAFGPLPPGRYRVEGRAFGGALASATILLDGQAEKTVRLSF